MQITLKGLRKSSYGFRIYLRASTDYFMQIIDPFETIYALVMLDYIISLHKKVFTDIPLVDYHLIMGGPGTDLFKLIRRPEFPKLMK